MNYLNVFPENLICFQMRFQRGFHHFPIHVHILFEKKIRTQNCILFVSDKIQFRKDMHIIFFPFECFAVAVT